MHVFYKVFLLFLLYVLVSYFLISGLFIFNIKLCFVCFAIIVY